MVHGLAKILSVLILSFCLGILIMLLLAPLFANLASNTNDSSWWTVLPYANIIFTPIIFTLFFAIIGFKIYPNPKPKSKK
jgi:uncharacterized BrkB/YihY/UPF0761 family membrane protein